MSTLENLVPPKELCNEIPPGEFDNSVFGWKYINGYSHSEWELVLRTESDVDCPAPTLAEILKVLAEGCDGACCFNATEKGIWYAKVEDLEVVEEISKRDKNPATAALKLWLELNKEQ